MEMIVIYDNLGRIYSCSGGSVGEPVGIPFIKVVIPDNKHLVAVDVETKTPVFEDLPVSETDKLNTKLEALTGELLDTQEALAALFESMGV